MTRSLGLRLAFLVALALAPVALVPGCTCVMSTSPDSGGGVIVGTPMPPPVSPAQAVRALEWTWDQRASAEYPLLFAADLGQSCDSAASAWTRDDEIASFDHMVFGGGAQGAPVPGLIQLDFPTLLAATPDPRPGHAARWHQVVAGTFRLALSGAGVRPETLTGDATFYLVRGDSAAIPEDLLAAGVTPDSTRWYFERMAFVRAVAATTPTTWCELRERYR